MAAAGTQGTLVKTKSAYATTEATITLAGGQTSLPFLTEGLPFASVQIAQTAGTNVTSVTPQYSNDGVTFVAGAAVNFASLPALQDLYTLIGATAISPAKFIQFAVTGGDSTSVVQIVLILMGARG